MFDPSEFIYDLGSPNTPITEHIVAMMQFFTLISKEESIVIESVLKWDNEKKAAFFLVKSIFEGEEDV